MRQPEKDVVVVLDTEKTNKKPLAFDRGMRVLAEERRSFGLRDYHGIWENCGLVIWTVLMQLNPWE
jgi:hypothetical protein